LRRIIHLILFLVITINISCNTHNANIIKEVHIGLHNNNELKIQLDITTIKNAEVHIEYWADSIKNDVFTAASILPKGLTHRIVLCDIIPETNYSYRLITIQDGKKDSSKIYNFKSVALPLWLQDQFKYSCNQPELRPALLTF
jgi:arylsulfate sulfotransferase